MELVREDDAIWRIPKSGGMRVDGIVFASEPLIVKARDDRALEQVANVAHLPGIVGASLAMPDIHWGYGFPIGGVAATDAEGEGVVSPGGVGFDIGCGVRLLRSALSWEDVRPKIETLLDTLASRIPRGVGGKGLRHLNVGDLDGVLNQGVGWAISRGIGWEEDEELSEDGGKVEGADSAAISERAKTRGGAQLGSLGGGNHFVEVQAIEEIYNSAAADAMRLQVGGVCVMIHTGSRGIGHQTCTEEVKTFDRAMNRLGIEVPDRQLACAPVGSPEAQRYLAAMSAAANYARTNRHLLADCVRSCFEEVFRSSAEKLELQLVYDVSHNLAKLERHEVDGASRLLCVHRKGATRSLGAGDSHLPARYRKIGQPVLIPGSMGSTSFVLVGSASSSKISFSSTCHGAGRMMSRKAAVKQMGGHELKEKLRSQGILVRAQQMKLLSEEAPYAYKEAAEVVDVCEKVGLSSKVARLRPVAVVKG